MNGYIKKQAKQFFINFLKSKNWIRWHPGQLSSANTPVKIDMSINWYPEIGDKAIALTDKDAGGSFSMSMIPMIFLLVGKILPTKLWLLPRLCTTTTIATVSLYFQLFSFILVRKRGRERWKSVTEKVTWIFHKIFKSQVLEKWL